jgi:hypothetical protein
MIHELSLHFWDISIINLWWDIFQNHQRASSQSCGCSFFGKSVISILMANAANAQNLKCSKIGWCWRSPSWAPAGAQRTETAHRSAAAQGSGEGPTMARWKAG